MLTLLRWYIWAPVSHPYWRMRWAIWDFREQLLVRLISQQLKHHNTVYVHADPESPAVAMIVRMWARTVEPHSHVEGRPVKKHASKLSK